MRFKIITFIILAIMFMVIISMAIYILVNHNKSNDTSKINETSQKNFEQTKPLVQPNSSDNYFSCKSRCDYKYPDAISQTNYKYNEQIITKDTYDRLMSLATMGEALGLSYQDSQEILNKITELLVNDNYSTQKSEHKLCLMNC